MEYPPELAKDYSQKREAWAGTDKKVMEALESLDVRGKKIIDLGCGEGSHAKMIKDMGADSVTGVDISEGMVVIAQEKIGENSKDINFAVADGKSLPLRSGSADIVFSNFVLHYFPNAGEVFQEISRVLKEEGYFVGTFNITDVEKGYEHLYNQKMPIVLGQGENTVKIENLIKSCQEIEEAIRDAGLFIKKEEELNHPGSNVEESYEHKDHITKHAMLFILQKTIPPDASL
jgi:ubiquinone/menaquinone biosynthesis C-methylase UbiE